MEKKTKATNTDNTANCGYTVLATVPYQKCPVCEVTSEEFVEDFTSDGELTPIDIVSEITGLPYDEIKSCSKIVRVP